MEVTFMLSPITVLSRYPVASRVLTSNLLRDDRLNVEFLQTGIQSFAKGAKIYKEKVLPEIEKIGTMRSEFIKWWSGNEVFGRFPMIYAFAGHFDKEIIEKIKTEYVLFSAPTIMDFNFIKSLINSDKKIVVGGSSTQIYRPNELRDILIKSGANKEKTNKNLIIVSGYVDLETDLYSIIKKWKDHIITKNNLKTIWNARDDFMLDYVNILKNLYSPTINILLNSECWWGKCRFCTHKHLPCINFDEDISVTELMNYVNDLSRKYKTKGIFFNDSYIINSPKVMEFMQRLDKEGYRIDIYTGILLLKNPKYIEFINRCNIQKLYIGMEHTNNFSLDFIKKGYHKEDILKAVDIMAKNLNHNTNAVLFNMIDIPVENEKQIIENWETLLKIRQKFQKYGSNCYYNFSMLRNYPKTEMVDNDLLRFATREQMNDDDLIGVWNIYKFFEKCGIDLSGISQEITYPIVRYLPNGKQLKSDLYITDVDIMRDITCNGNK